jgi:hypothetical protein
VACGLTFAELPGLAAVALMIAVVEASTAGHLPQGGIGREARKHRLGADHAERGLAGFGVEGDPAGQSHVERHRGVEHRGRLLGLAHLEDAALLRERQALAAQGMAQTWTASTLKPWSTTASWGGNWPPQKISACRE